MKKYRVLFSKFAAKEIRQLENIVIKRVLDKSKELETEPRPAGCKKLVGEKEDLWRVEWEITGLFIQLTIKFLS